MLARMWRKAVWRLFKKLKLEVPHVIPLLGIYPKECKSGYNKNTCTSMFIAVLFTTTNLWKQTDALQLMNGLRKCYMHTGMHTYIYIYICMYNGILLNHKE
jgi:hypothetical protein